MGASSLTFVAVLGSVLLYVFLAAILFFGIDAPRR